MAMNGPQLPMNGSIGRIGRRSADVGITTIMDWLRSEVRTAGH